MTNLNPLLDRNKLFAETGVHNQLNPGPNHQVLVITCMDGRVDPAHILGIELGGALVIRNAGGRVTDDAIHEIAFIATLSETLLGENAQQFEVAIVHHTGCGSAYLANGEFRRTFAARIDADEHELAAQAVVDPTATVQVDVARLIGSPLLPKQVSVSGHVYDIGTGLVTTTVPANRP